MTERTTIENIVEKIAKELEPEAFVYWLAHPERLKERFDYKRIIDLSDEEIVIKIEIKCNKKKDKEAI